MLLGIDASRVSAEGRTGTENYSHQLIRSLLLASSPLRFRLYTRALPPSGLYPPTGNHEIRAIPFPRVWTHARLSAELLLHPPDALFVPAHVLPLIHPARSFVTVHDLGYLYFPKARRPLDQLYLDLSTRWNATAARAVIADSEATRSDLVRHYRIDAHRVHVIYPALNPEWQNLSLTARDRANARQKYGLAGEYILAVGTIQPRKNYPRLFEAFAKLPDELVLVVAGKKGWLYEETFATVDRLQLKNRVCFLDYVSESDLPALYAGARLAIMPSLYEGFGFPVLEAQATGVPLACSNSSSLTEVAGAGAEFFDPRNVDEMAASMRRLLTDEARREELIELGRRNVQRFAWEKAARQVLDLVTSGP